MNRRPLSASHSWCALHALSRSNRRHGKTCHCLVNFSPSRARLLAGQPQQPQQPLLLPRRPRPRPRCRSLCCLRRCFDPHRPQRHRARVPLTANVNDGALLGPHRSAAIPHFHVPAANIHLHRSYPSRRCTTAACSRTSSCPPACCWCQTTALVDTSRRSSRSHLHLHPHRRLHFHLCVAAAHAPPPAQARAVRAEPDRHCQQHPPSI
jgi:hypothetical protein